jgi:hypothetical protein
LIAVLPAVSVLLPGTSVTLSRLLGLGMGATATLRKAASMLQRFQQHGLSTGNDYLELLPAAPLSSVQLACVYGAAFGEVDIVIFKDFYP